MELQLGDERCKLFSYSCDPAGFLGALSQLTGVVLAPRMAAMMELGVERPKKFEKKEIFEI